MNPLLADFYVNSEKQSDIVIRLGETLFYFHSLILKHVCPELLAFCQRKGFKQDNSSQQLIKTDQDNLMVVVSKWIHTIADNTILLTTMFSFQQDIYQIQSLDEEMKEWNQQWISLFRYFGLESYLIKYYSAIIQSDLMGGGKIELIFNPTHMAYNDRILIFLSQKQLAQPAWDGFIWTLNPTDLASILESPKLILPAAFTEDILAQKIGTYISGCAEHITPEQKKRLIMILNPKQMNINFITENLPAICSDPFILFELLQKKEVNARSYYEAKTSVPTLVTDFRPTKEGETRYKYALSPKFKSNNQGYKLVSIDHFKKNKESIKDIISNSCIELLNDCPNAYDGKIYKIFITNKVSGMFPIRINAISNLSLTFHDYVVEKVKINPDSKIVSIGFDESQYHWHNHYDSRILYLYQKKQIA